MFNFNQVNGNAQAQALVVLTPHEEGSIHALVVENTSGFDRQITVNVGGKPIVVDAPKGTSYPQLKLNLPPATAVEVTAPFGVRVSGSYIKQPIDDSAAAAVVSGLVQAANDAADRAEGAVPAGAVDDSIVTASNVYSAQKVEEIATQLGDQATLSRSAVRNQIDVIQLETPKHAPIVAVTCEDPQLGVTNSQWDVNVDGSNFDCVDYALAEVVTITEEGDPRQFTRAYRVELLVGEFDPATEGMTFITGDAKAVLQDIDGNVATLRGHNDLPIGPVDSGEWELRDIIPDIDDGLVVARVIGTTGAGIAPDLDHSGEWIYSTAAFSARKSVSTTAVEFVQGVTRLADARTEMERRYSPDGRWGYAAQWSTTNAGTLQVLRAPLGNRWDFTTRLFDQGEMHLIAGEGPWGTGASSTYLVTDDHHIYLFRASNTDLEVCKVKVSGDGIDYVRDEGTEAPITFSMRTTEGVPPGYATGVEWGDNGRKVYIVLSGGMIAQFNTAAPYQLEGAEFEVAVTRPSNRTTDHATLTWLDDGRWLIEISAPNGRLRVETPYDLGTLVRSSTLTASVPAPVGQFPIYLGRPGARTGAWAYAGTPIQIPTSVNMYMPSTAHTYAAGGSSTQRDWFYDPYADLVIGIIGGKTGSSTATNGTLTPYRINPVTGVVITSPAPTPYTVSFNYGENTRVWVFNGHTYFALGHSAAGYNSGFTYWLPPVSNPDGSYAGIGNPVSISSSVVPMPNGEARTRLADFWVSEDGTQALIATTTGHVGQYVFGIPFDPRTLALVDQALEVFPATVPDYFITNRVWFGPNGEWVGYSDVNNPNTIKRKYFSQPGVVASIDRGYEACTTINQSHSTGVRFSHRTGHLRLVDVLYPFSENMSHVYGGKVAITNADIAKLDTRLWTNVNSASVETRGSGSVEFLFSTDEKLSFFTYTYADDTLMVRPVMQYVDGAWQINNAEAFDELNWVAPVATDMLEVAIEASELPHNAITDGELTAMAEYFPLGESLDVIALMQEGGGPTPISLLSVTFDYDANVTQRGAVPGVDYVYDAQYEDSVRIRYLKNGNYKVRIL